MDHFDFIAPFYDQLARPPDRTRFQRLLKLPYDGRLLDAGGGTAGISSNLSGMIGQIVVSDLLRVLKSGGRLAIEEYDLNHNLSPASILRLCQ